MKVCPSLPPSNFPFFLFSDYSVSMAMSKSKVSQRPSAADVTIDDGPLVSDCLCSFHFVESLFDVKRKYDTNKTLGGEN